MFKVYELFEDGKKFLMFQNKDRFTCEVWLINHTECTNALRIKKSLLVIVED